MAKKQRFSQADIAEQLGVSKATVSLVLRGIGNFAKETEEKIRRLAREQGYVPDPMLGALSAYRRKEGENPFMGTLGFFLPRRPDLGWFLEPLWKKGKQRARALGYAVERFSAALTDTKPHRLAKVLQARGIRGLIIGEKIRPEFWDQFPWHQFYSITITRTNINLPIDMVNHDATTACHHVWEECVKRGYRRLAVVLNRKGDQNIQKRSFYTFLGLKNDSPETFAENDLIYDDNLTAASWKAWWKKGKPDVVICHNEDTINKIKAISPKALSGKDVACVSLQNPLGGISGIHLPPAEIMDSTLALLDHGIRHSLLGLSEHKRVVLLEGKWIEGKTLRKKKGPSK